MMRIADAAEKSAHFSPLRAVGRLGLGAALTFAGVSHLTFARASFTAQVPDWLPLDADFVVVASGVVEVLLGLSLALLPRWKVPIGWVTAAFFVAVFPGNISQFTTGTDAFGLDSDLARGVRLVFQPLLVVWALWSTGAWRAWRASRSHTGDQSGVRRRYRKCPPPVPDPAFAATGVETSRAISFASLVASSARRVCHRAFVRSTSPDSRHCPSSSASSAAANTAEMTPPASPSWENVTPTRSPASRMNNAKVCGGFARRWLCQRRLQEFFRCARLVR